MSLRVHVATGSTTQFHPLPFKAVTSNPNGGASSTSTVFPAAFASAPTFVTVSVYWTPRWPATKLPECVLLIARSGTATMTAESLDTLLARLDSGWPVSVTRATLTSGVVALAAIFAMTTSSGYADPAASASLRVQAGGAV